MAKQMNLMEQIQNAFIEKNREGIYEKIRNEMADCDMEMKKAINDIVLRLFPDLHRGYVEWMKINEMSDGIN